MKVFAKLIGAFSAVALVCAVVGGIGWYGIYHTEKGLVEVSDVRLPAVQGLGQMMEKMAEIQTAERTLVVAGLSHRERQGLLGSIPKLWKDFDSGLAVYRDLPKSDQESSVWQHYLSQLKAWKLEQKKLLDLVGSVSLDDVDRLGGVLVSRQLDHVKWGDELSRAIANQEAFFGATDPAACALGIWMKSYRSDDPKFMAFISRFAAPHDKLHELGAQISTLIDKEQYGRARELYETEVRPLLFAMDGIFREALAYVRDQRGKFDTALKIAFGSEKQAFTAAMTQLEKLAGMNRAVTAEVRSDAKQNAEKSKLVSLVTVLFGVLTAQFFGFLIARMIARPMASTVEMIQELEQGHLDVRLGLNSQDEIGTMAKAMDRFADNLQHELVGSLEKIANGDLTVMIEPRDERDAIRGSLGKLGTDLNAIFASIRQASEQVNYGSTKVAESSQSLSQGATEQASSLEEISASMSEMAAKTRQNADRATQANQLSTNAQQAAERGNSQMRDMVAAMEEMNSSSQNISKIIKVIDEIAFQTNLLALNAAVEAARAGQHGKGFAVVAEEVRNLAARSAQAARETAELIEGSVARTSKGSEIATHTAAALDEIVSGIHQVSTLVEEIADASHEQAQGIDQVNAGLGQIDEVTQQNTANAEESAAASEELSNQAGQLLQLLGQFQLSYHGAASGAESSRWEKQAQLPAASSGSWAGLSFQSSNADELIAWSDALATGIRVVDQQHQQLVEMINGLFVSMRSGGDKGQVAETIQGLIDYAAKHFATEENLMQKYAYPAFSEHKSVHECFVAEVLDFQQRFNEGKRIVPAEIFNFLKGWLINHIKQEDRDGYGPYLVDKGVR